MTTNILYPTTKLFPHHPQILHQMVLQFFLMAEKYEQIFEIEKMFHAIIMPYGSYFDTGVIQAAGYRYRIQAIKPQQIVLISFEELPQGTDMLGCSYDALHTFFGQLTVDKAAYDTLPDIRIDDTLFAKHADPIICQLPFLRSYQKINHIVPLIVNKKMTALQLKKLWTAIRDRTGKTGYVICSNHTGASIEQISHAYESVTTEQLLTFGPEQRIS